MNLDQIDDAVRLRNYRRNVISLANAARSSFMELSFSGHKSPDSYISLQCVRDAVIAECLREQAKYEAELMAMGVTFPDPASLSTALPSGGE